MGGSGSPSGGASDASGGSVGIVGGQSASGGRTGEGSGGAHAAGGAAPLGTLTVDGLQVELNSKMNLGAYVTWTTAEPANSEVEFGESEFVMKTTGGDELVTEHKVHVVGMRPETLYKLRARSTSATATGSADGEITTGALPTFLPDKADVVTPAGSSTAPGYTLMNFWDSGNSPTVAVIVDPEGYPVWYYVNGTARDQFGATSTDVTPDGTILIGNAGNEPARDVDLEGNILWVGPTGGDAALSHHTSKLKTGNYLVVRESSASARVEEVDAEKKVVWSFDLYEDSPVTNNGANDWCHLNSVRTDASEKYVFFNCRYQGLFKIDKATKAIVWHMGAAMDDSQSGDVTYKPDNSVRFNDAHDPEVHEDGTALFYDNQGWSNRNVGEANGNFHTRLVEYMVDDAKKEATLTWEFPGSFSTDAWYKDDWSTPIWGDANRLANGNVLVAAGVTGTGGGGMTKPGTKSRIFEVTREGQAVWAIEWPEGKGTYRATRLSLPVEALP
jgi:hypothetical protein